MNPRILGPSAHTSRGSCPQQTLPTEVCTQLLYTQVLDHTQMHTETDVTHRDRCPPGTRRIPKGSAGVVLTYSSRFSAVFSVKVVPKVLKGGTLKDVQNSHSRVPSNYPTNQSLELCSFPPQPLFPSPDSQVGQARYHHIHVFPQN